MNKYNPNIHHRKSIRLKNYDYSQAGLYFITICVQNQECLFWEIVGADLRVCPNDEIGVCPNIDNETKYDQTIQIEGEHIGSPLHRVVQWFKTMTTNEYIRGVKNLGWQPFNGKLWQRNYWEHIIRNEQSYKTISEYIINNPEKWVNDKFYIQ
jgi:REP element-mobilizing transposase RayT